MTWYDLMSLLSNKYEDIKKKFGLAIDFFELKIIFYIDSVCYRLGWKVSASGFIPFQPLFKKPLDAENNIIKPKQHGKIHK